MRQPFKISPSSIRTMKPRKVLCRAWFAAALPPLMAGPVLGQGMDAYPYAIIDFQNICHVEAYSWWIADHTVVTGPFFTRDRSAYFLLKDGVFTFFNGLDPGGSSNLGGVNASGEVVGWSTDANGIEQPVLWIDGVAQVLGNFGEGSGGAANAINDLGHVVGNAFEDGFQHDFGFIWRDGVLTRIEGYNGHHIEPQDINNNDQVVGRIVDSNNRRHAFLWENGVMTDLGSIGRGGAVALGINDRSQVVGFYIDDQDGRMRSFIWQDGQMRSIHDDAVFGMSYAGSINNSGVAVGNGGDQNPVDGFVWDEANGMRNLDALVPPNSSWNIRSTGEINNQGQIVGEGNRGHGSGVRGYMMTPVVPVLLLDEPSSRQAGSEVTLTVHGAEPGELVTFVYGRIGGGYQVPACDYTTGAVFQVDDPAVIGSATAASNGDASISAFVPFAARHAGDILLQAVEQSQCRISQLRVVRFQ